MGEVDIEDDGARRFVVSRYAYDPVRRERRHIVVAVVDNHREYERLIDRFSQELQQRRATTDVDPREHISGTVMEPGHLARAANGHLVRRALEHGVWPDRIRSLDLPGNMAVFTADSSEQ